MSGFNNFISGMMNHIGKKQWKQDQVEFYCTVMAMAGCEFSFHQIEDRKETFKETAVVMKKIIKRAKREILRP